MIFSGGGGGERREPGRDCTLYSRTCAWVKGAYNVCELRQVEWDITCLSYKTVFFNKIYLSYHLSKFCSLLFISFLLFIQFRSVSAGASLFQYHYQRSIALYIMHYWPSVSLDAVYWPSLFFFAPCQCPESWPNKVDPRKGMYKNWTKENFLSRDEQIRLAHLARWGSQSVQRNRFILPARGFSHIYNKIAYHCFLSTWDLWKHPSFLFRVSTILE